MRKVILMVMLAAVSSNAMADWVRVNQDEEMTVYAHPSSIRNKSSKVKMWSLYDYQLEKVLPSGKSYQSMKVQEEYDCKREETRTLGISFHAGNMSAGEVIFTGSKAQGWKSVSPETAQESLFKYACGKK